MLLSGHRCLTRSNCGCCAGFAEKEDSAEGGSEIGLEIKGSGRKRPREVAVKG